MSAVAPVTDATFQSEVLESELPVVVDIWATWCGPCKAIAPILDQLAGAYAGRVKIVKVDADQNRRLWPRQASPRSRPSASTGTGNGWTC